MAIKTVPFSEDQIKQMIEKYGSPFHVYDERAIRENIRSLMKAFSWAPEFREYFAVKATPNPFIIKLLHEEGCGADCSSLAELILAEKAGLRGEKIMFSSNNTPVGEFVKAKELGAIINLDDLTHLDCLRDTAGIPEMISFRYNPGPARAGGNAIIGRPEEAKYGLTKEQLFTAYERARELGAVRFGMHTMIISNELNAQSFVDTARMMFELAGELYDRLGIRVELINFGGGIGIPYLPEEEAVDYNTLGKEIKALYEKMIAARGLAPISLAMELGRVITGPYGYLVTKVIHRKDIYKKYIGVDACMADLMRPAIYGAYHHITIIGKEDQPADHIYDVTGGLCENNDKFAIDRHLPAIDIGDILVIHDTGAHGHAMGFNYNGKLRSPEILFKSDGSTKLIRRRETLDDLFATLDFSEL